MNLPKETNTERLIFRSIDDPMGQLVIIEDGHDIVNDTEAMERAMRAEALAFLGNRAMEAVKASPKAVGRFLLELVDQAE